MNKTLLNHFTVIHSLTQDAVGSTGMRDECLTQLTLELKHVLLQGEHELLSPRQEAIDQLLSKALH